jgi:ABC-type nitrate/sulfonate/bicarbonate transport system substrate-binding protein
MRFIQIGFAVMAMVMAGLPARAAEKQLKLIMFQGTSGLPVFVAQDKGFFAKYGLDVEVTYTPTSDFQRKSLAEGKFDIAPTGADNAVFMVDTGAGDAVIVAGGDNSANELIAQPTIRRYADIKGKAVVVDAPNTAYAFQLYKMLALKGVKQGDYTVLSKGGTPQRLAAMKEDKNNAGAMMSPPLSIAAQKEGFHSLGSVATVLGPYQGGAVAVLRSWAKANGDTLVNFLKAEILASRWAFDPKNRAELEAIVAKRAKLDEATIKASVEGAVGRKHTLDKDMRLSMAGFRETLKLRAEFAGKPGAKPASATRYLDLSYYKKALAGL